MERNFIYSSLFRYNFSASNFPSVGFYLSYCLILYNFAVLKFCEILILLDTGIKFFDPQLVKITNFLYAAPKIATPICSQIPPDFIYIHWLVEKLSSLFISISRSCLAKYRFLYVILILSIFPRLQIFSNILKFIEIHY